MLLDCYRETQFSIVVKVFFKLASSFRIQKFLFLFCLCLFSSVFASKTGTATGSGFISFIQSIFTVENDIPKHAVFTPRSSTHMWTRRHHTCFFEIRILCTSFWFRVVWSCFGAHLWVPWFPNCFSVDFFLILREGKRSSNTLITAM